MAVGCVLAAGARWYMTSAQIVYEGRADGRLLEGFKGVASQPNKAVSSDNDRMKELLNSSEDHGLAPMQGRFWYTETPSHLTPERIDGPIQ
jgi:hypothetical protein